MDALLGSKLLPPGFRFHPTDEELFMFYLKRKVMGKSLRHQIMSEVDVNKFAPWELPAKACLRTTDLSWYFICPRSRMHPSGGRSKRATEHGYWKSTGNDRTVNYKNRPVGKIKTLVFHRGKPPNGVRTDWVMHEYRLEDKVLSEQGIAQDSHVICKLFEKSGRGPKNGENYGGSFVEEEWDNDNDDNLESSHGLVLHPGGHGTDDENVASIQQPVSVDATDLNGSTVTTSLACPSMPSTVQQPYFATMEGLPAIETEEDELDRMLAKFTEHHNLQPPVSNGFNGLEDLAGGSSASKANVDWWQCVPEDWYIWS
ncbi:hypothetical protein vseg_021549 [Gypsophila vaccaria]